MKAYLILEDGTVFTGKSIGSTKEIISEIVFNTSMTGYLEVLTDPSYAGQAVVMTYPLIGNYLSGTTASGLYEARLGWEKMGKENHVFAPAYKTEDMQELVKICDHIIFNSFSQYEKHKLICQDKSESIRTYC